MSDLQHLMIGGGKNLKRATNHMKSKRLLSDAVPELFAMLRRLNGCFMQILTYFSSVSIKCSKLRTNDGDAPEESGSAPPSTCRSPDRSPPTSKSIVQVSKTTLGRRAVKRKEVMGCFVQLRSFCWTFHPALWDALSVLNRVRRFCRQCKMAPWEWLLGPVEGAGCTQSVLQWKLSGTEFFWVSGTCG